MLALLSDGQRHHREELMSIAMPLVPHARAVRVRNKSAERQRGRQASARPMAIEDQARVGQREVVTMSLNSILRSGAVKRDGDWFWLAGEDDR